MANETTKTISLDDITVRNELRPGDIGYVIYLHGALYGAEFGYGIDFETYVAQGFHEFYEKYDPEVDRAWICEHDAKIVGFLLLMNRGDAAQLRYFLIHSDYRGFGLGKKLMNLYMEFLEECGYESAYLWTTNELGAAASLYKRHGFELTEEKPSTDFNKPLIEQKYELNI